MMQNILDDLQKLAVAARLERDALDALVVECAFTRSEYRGRSVLNIAGEAC